MSQDDDYSRQARPHLVAAMRGLEDLGRVLDQAEDAGAAADQAAITASTAACDE
jgi:hypothetical protein